MHYNFKQLIITRLITENLFLLLLQFTGMMFSVFSSQPLPVDFAAGTAAAFIFMRGYTILPGIWLGTFLAASVSGLSFMHCSSLASVYTLQTALLFWFCLRFISPGLIFIDRNVFLRFALLCAAVPLLFSPLLPSWQADMAGLLILTLTITSWDNYFPEIAQWRTIPNFITIAGLFVAALTINLIIYMGFDNHMNNISLFIYLISVIAIISGIRQPNMK